jgi:hypothetical protein
MRMVNGATSTVAALAPRAGSAAPPAGLSRARRAAAWLRLAAADVAAIGGAVLALAPLLGRRRPVGRAPPDPAAAEEPERAVLPR